MLTVEFEFVGSKRLLLDHESFSYAGKYRLPTNKVVARDCEGDVVAALSYDEDRVDEAARIRYLSVRDDHQQEGVAQGLVEYAAERLLEEYDAVKISVNNPYAYEAVHRAGFRYTGGGGPQNEVVLQRPLETAEEDGYAKGLRRLLEADLPEEQSRYIERKLRD